MEIVKRIETKKKREKFMTLRFMQSEASELSDYISPLIHMKQPQNIF